MIEPDGVGNGGTSWGSSHGFPEQEMADKSGEFTLAQRRIFERVQLRVNAPSMGPL